MIYDVPVSPDAPTAQKWAEDELSQGIYHPHQNPVEWLITKVSEFFERLTSTTQAGQAGLWLAAGIGIAVIIVLIMLIGPMRRRYRTSRSASQLDARGVTAADLRQQARQALTGQDWDLASLLAYRALVQSSIERTILQPTPGLTAHEASTGIALALPTFHDDLIGAGQFFDSLAYGHVHATAGQAQRLVDLEAALLRARPDFNADAVMGDEALTTGMPTGAVIR